MTVFVKHVEHFRITWCQDSDKMSSESCLVKAIYSFKGKNNDELCFKKGDIITVTQKEEGGWWEGTLGETTGWFPSNYVTEHKGNFAITINCTTF